MQTVGRKMKTEGLMVEELQKWRAEQKILYASKATRDGDHRVCLYVQFTDIAYLIEIKNKKHELVDSFRYCLDYVQEALRKFNNL